MSGRSKYPSTAFLSRLRKSSHAGRTTESTGVKLCATSAVVGNGQMDRFEPLLLLVLLISSQTYVHPAVLSILHTQLAQLTSSHTTDPLPFNNGSGLGFWRALGILLWLWTI